MLPKIKMLFWILIPILVGLGGCSVPGGDGNDIIFAGDYPVRDGHTALFPGNDVMLGGRGDDILIGDDGHDGILGFGGNDIIIGGAGNDRINGNSGDDYIDGGAGTQDLCRGGDGADSAINCEIQSGIERQSTRSFPFIR